MKQKILFLSATALSLAVILTQCKKESAAVDNTAEVSTHSDDQSRFAAETDAVANDADLTLETTSYLRSW